MTTMTMNFGSNVLAPAAFHGNSFVKPRAPRRSFAARLAALQARHEQSEQVVDIAGVVARSVLALVPFTVLAWVFVAV